MKYVELSEKSLTITFSKEAKQAMKLKEGSRLLIFKIKDQAAFGFQERAKVDFDKMMLVVTQKPTRYSRRLSAETKVPTPILMLDTMGIYKPKVKLKLKEHINEQGQIIYYIGTWKNS